MPEEVRRAVDRQAAGPLQPLGRAIEGIQPLHRLQELAAIELHRRSAAARRARRLARMLRLPLVALRNPRRPLRARRRPRLCPAERHVEVHVEDPRGDPEKVRRAVDRQAVGSLQALGRHVVLVQPIHRGEKVAAIEDRLREKSRIGRGLIADGGDRLWSARRRPRRGLLLAGQQAHGADREQQRRRGSGYIG